MRMRRSLMGWWMKFWKRRTRPRRKRLRLSRASERIGIGLATGCRGGDIWGFFARFSPTLSHAEPARAWGVALAQPARARWFFGKGGGEGGNFIFVMMWVGMGFSFFILPKVGLLTTEHYTNLCLRLQEKIRRANISPRSHEGREDARRIVNRE